MGLLLAGRLAAGGHAVRLVARTAEQAEAVARDGIAVAESDEAGPVCARVQTIAFSSYLRRESGGGEPPDWILLAVKQKDIAAELLGAMAVNLGASTRICCFQNGQGHLDKLRGILSEDRLYAAVTTEGAVRTGPAQVLHTGRGTTKLGFAGSLNDGQKQPDSAADLVQGLKQAGFSVQWSSSIHRDIWNKLIINTVINPVSALLEVPNGELLHNEQCLLLMKSLYQEAYSLADAAGVGSDADLWERLLEVCRATAANPSSMLQDIRAGRPTELEWLTGSLLREAMGIGMALPVHETVYRLVRAKEELGQTATGLPSAGRQ